MIMNIIKSYLETPQAMLLDRRGMGFLQPLHFQGELL